MQKSKFHKKTNTKHNFKPTNKFTVIYKHNDSPVASEIKNKMFKKIFVSKSEMEACATLEELYDLTKPLALRRSFMLLVCVAVEVGLIWANYDALKQVQAIFILDILTLVAAALALPVALLLSYRMTQCTLLSFVIAVSVKSITSYVQVFYILGKYGWLDSLTSTLVVGILFAVLYMLFGYLGYVILCEYKRITRSEQSKPSQPVALEAV